MEGIKQPTITEVEKFGKWLRDRELAENTVKAYVGSMMKFFSAYTEVTKENGVRWKNKLLNDQV